MSGNKGKNCFYLIFVYALISDNFAEKVFLLMKPVKDYIVYVLFRLIVLIFKIMPWPVLYRLSRIVYVFLYFGIKYRRKVVRQNLDRLFPNKTEEWKDTVQRSFYRHLSDIFLESIKGYDLSPNNLLSRFTLENPDKLQEIEAKYPHIIVASAHCGNWEWGAMAAPLLMKCTTYGLYKPLSNSYIDRWIRRRRAVQGMHLVPIAATSSMFRSNEASAAYFFITDQHPSRRASAIWVRLLGYPTAWLHGVEKYSRIHNLPVFYFGIRRSKRGFYTVFIREIALHPNALPYGEITRSYVKILEESLLDDPVNWLWTHRRWKYEPETGETIFE